MRTMITAALLFVATTFAASAASARTSAEIRATNAYTDQLIAEQLAALRGQATTASATAEAVPVDSASTDWWAHYLNVLELETVAKRRAAAIVAAQSF